jgi:hypothetical protein
MKLNVDIGIEIYIAAEKPRASRRRTGCRGTGTITAST